MVNVHCRRWGFAFLSLVLLSGCGGGSSGASSQTIGGKVTGKTFTVPSGQTLTVTSDLVVNTTDSITIDGTLAIPAGINVALLSDGPVNINGSLSVAPTPALVKATTRGGSTTDTVIASSGGKIDGFGAIDGNEIVFPVGNPLQLVHPVNCHRRGATGGITGERVIPG